MRQTLFTLLLLAGIGHGWAQGIYYERWVDNNFIGHQFGWLQTGEQTIEVDLSQIPSAGLHFLNIIPYTKKGEPGCWKIIAFLMPECWPGTTEAVTFEYWLSDDLGTLVRKSYTSGEHQFSIDISNMSYGLHFLNYRTFNERGEPGAWKKEAFYIANGAFDREAVGYQYWIDSGEKQNGTGYAPGILSFKEDISQLAKGKHTFNFRLCYSDDPDADDAQFGDTVSETFEITDILVGDANGDGSVTINDAVGIVNNISGNPSVGFNEAAADVNGDSKITITDAVGVVNIIVNSGAAAAPGMEKPAEAAKPE